MYKVVILVFCLYALSCSYKENKLKKGNEDSLTHIISNRADTLKEIIFSRKIFEKTINDSIISLRIFADMEVHWNTKISKIEEDSLFRKIRDQFQVRKLLLANEIKNTFETQALSCPKGKKLAVGDIAYLITDKIVNIPFLKITGIQLDQFQQDCHYPVDLFNLLRNRRSYITLCVKNYVLSIMP